VGAVTAVLIALLGLAATFAGVLRASFPFISSTISDRSIPEVLMPLFVLVVAWTLGLLHCAVIRLAWYIKVPALIAILTGLATLGMFSSGRPVIIGAAVVTYLAVIVLMFARRRRLSELLGGLAIWAGIFLVVLVGYAYRDDLGGVASRVFGELMPGAAVVDESHGTATFRSGVDGHFQINTQVNGSGVRAIFDTGASAVVLTAADARRAGIDTSALRYDMPVSTANGIGRASVVTLDTVEVGGIVRHNVRAFVAEKGALDTSLLGMSFLGTLRSYTVTANSLELTD
jgi:aspartyl protease family protein